MQTNQERLHETALLIERLVAVGLFVGLLVMVALILRPFLTAILFGGIIVIATWPIHEWLGRRGLSNGVVTLVLTSAAVAFVIVPAVFVTPRLVRQLVEFAPRVQSFLSDAPDLPVWVSQLPLFGPRVERLWSQVIHGQVQDVAGPYAATIRKAIIDVAGTLAEGVVQIILSLALAAMLWLRGDVVRNVLQNLALRFAGRFGGRALNEAAASVKGVAYGILGTAAAQALMLTVGLLIARVPGAVLLGFLSLLIALSQIGILLTLIWGGAAWWLYVHDAKLSAIFIIVWGLVVSVGDNVIRPFLVGYGVTMPMTLVFLGVLGGFIAFGFLGMFIGPTVLAVFVSLIAAWRRTDRL